MEVLLSILISAISTIGNIIYTRSQRHKVESERRNIDATTALRKSELERLEQDTTFQLYEKYQRATNDVLRLQDEVFQLKGDYAEIKANFHELSAKLSAVEANQDARERAYSASETLRTELERSLNQERSLRVQYELENRSLASRLAKYEGGPPE